MMAQSRHSDYAHEFVKIIRRERVVRPEGNVTRATVSSLTSHSCPPHLVVVV